MSEKIEKLIIELKNDPILQMSLHSKELFHSNFWAWLFDRNIEYANIFFPGLRTIGEEGVKREQGNRDITIWGREIEDQDPKAFIIENKFKSIPYMEQLIEYQSEVENKFGKGILAGIEKPGFDLPFGWNFKSYREICSGIMDIAEKEPEGFEKDLINHYAAMLSKLTVLIEEVIESAPDSWVTHPKYCDIWQLGEIRMDDIVKKLIASKFVTYMKDRIKKEGLSGVEDKSELICYSFYAHKHAAVDVTYRRKDDKYGLCIQIEDSQYRWGVFDKSIPGTEIYEKYKALGWFKEFEKGNPIKDGMYTSMRNAYCQYGSDFVYQYYNIDEVLSSFDTLATRIIKDIKEAVRIFEKIN